MYWSEVPGTIFFYVPESVLDKNMTVIAVKLDGKLDLFN
jgi:alpha-L-fucosidase